MRQTSCSSTPPTGAISPITSAARSSIPSSSRASRRGYARHVPTRKQRRRRQKELRHEWEEVYVDAEGRELAPEEVEELAPAITAKTAQPRARTKPAAHP